MISRLKKIAIFSYQQLQRQLPHKTEGPQGNHPEVLTQGDTLLFLPWSTKVANEIRFSSCVNANVFFTTELLYRA